MASKKHSTDNYNGEASKVDATTQAQVNRLLGRSDRPASPATPEDRLEALEAEVKRREALSTDETQAEQLVRGRRR